MSRPRSRWVLAAVLAGLTGGVAACGGHVAGAGSGGTGTGTGTVPSVTLTLTTSTTSTLVGIPGATLTSTDGTTTTVLPGSTKPPVLLGDMNTPEQFVLGALYQDALETEGYSVQLNRNIGPVNVSEAALAQGSLDIYPEYLNLYNHAVVKNARHYRRLSQAYAAAQRYARSQGETLLKPTPFSDTAGIAVLTTYARAHHLRTLGDLSRVQTTLTLGSPPQFTADPQGLDALERAYGWSPAVTTAVNIGTQYRGLRNGSLQAVYSQTTDWQLAEPLYTQLSDPQHVFGFGNVIPVVSTKVLAAEGPIFAETINRVDALLSTRVMRGLVAELQASPDPALAADGVARNFLQGNGLAAPPPWAILVPATPLTTFTTPTVAAEPFGRPTGRTAPTTTTHARVGVSTRTRTSGH